VLVEGAWSYRFGARVGRQLLERMTDLPKEVRDIAWKVRLCKRYRVLTARGKRVVATAVAREMAAFLWAIAQVVAPKEAAS
jgi:hypothetical protein